MSSPEFATLTTDDLVTGEAVALDLPPATVGARMASGLIDVTALVVLATGVLFLALVATANADGALRHVALVASLIVVFLVYPTTMETLTRGKSWGKAVIGLRVVRDDGGTVAVQQSFVRALIGIVEIYVFLGGPAFFCCLVSSHGKRIGDYAAGTYVVRDRFRLALPPPPAMPPVLAAVGRLRGPGHAAGRADARRPAVSRPAADARPRLTRPARGDAGDPDGGVRRATATTRHDGVGLPARGQRGPSGA